MRSRTASVLAAGCLLLTVASLALWGVSHWRSAAVGHWSATAGTSTAHWAWVEWGFVGYTHDWCTSPTVWTPPQWYTYLVPSDNPRHERWAHWRIDQEDRMSAGSPWNARVALAGFGVEIIRESGAAFTTVHIPLWFTAAVPGFFAYRLYRRARRLSAKGLCPRCGYDLRVQREGGGGGCCPECGTEVAAAATDGVHHRGHRGHRDEA